MEPNNATSLKNTNKRHKCPIENCTASFPRPHKLEAHIRKHNGERPFQCDYPDCSKTYTNSSHLKRHKVTAHENKEDREYICSEKGCRLVFANKYILQKHLKRFHQETSFPFKCSNCDEKFKKRKHLSEHFNFVHDNVPYRCESCQLGFLSLIQYTKHKRNHRTFTCDCEKQFDRWTTFCKHRRTDCPLKQIEHTCVICKKTFKTKQNLKAHCIKIHVEESHVDTYKCPYMDCKRSYQYKRNLNYHIAFYHEKSVKDQQLKCTHEECDLVFKTERNLHRHLKHIHGEKIKKQKPRKPRKDRGKKKLSMAAFLSGIKLTSEEHLEIIKTSNSSGKDSISLTSLKISVPNNDGFSERNHMSEALKIENMNGTIRIPKVENHLQGKMLVVVVRQEPIDKLWKQQYVYESLVSSRISHTIFNPETEEFSDDGAISDSVILQKCDEILKRLPDLGVERRNGLEGDKGSDIVAENEQNEAVMLNRNERISIDDAVSDSVILQKCDEFLERLPDLDRINSLEDVSEQPETVTESEEIGNTSKELDIIEEKNEQNETELQNSNERIGIMVEIDEEIEKMLVDSSDNDCFNSLEFIPISNENGRVVQQCIKILKVIPAENTNSTNSEHIQCDIIA